MKEENYKQLYECLLETEDLHRMFRGLTGIWTKDKSKFIKAQKELEQGANIIDIDE